MQVLAGRCNNVTEVQKMRGSARMSKEVKKNEVKVEEKIEI